MNKKAPLSFCSELDRVQDLDVFQRYHIKRYAEIGMALSGEESLPRLLEMIVYEAREITNADAGTLYLVNDDRTHLDFVIMQNESMGLFLGGVEGGEITLPPVPLNVTGPDGVWGGENHSHVSAYVALTAEIINIPDVYESKAFDFSGTRVYDQQSGYRSRSMLVIPMRNHEKDIIGVLQLLNARDPESGEVVEFKDDFVSLVASLASQAAVTLTKTRLIKGLTELLDAFIRSIAQAIEEKSRYTGGHIARVSKLVSLIAEEINQVEHGPFAEVHFSHAELEELRLAAWLHDIGKIITPASIQDKSRKLETIFDRSELVNVRFDLIRKSIEVRHLHYKLKLLDKSVEDDVPEGLDDVDADFENELRLLEEDRALIMRCNTPGEPLTADDLKQLQQIAAKTYEHKGEQRPYLEQEELAQLSIPSGTLSEEERAVMEDHAGLTWRMLSTLPFPKHLRRVPEFASQHHEKLDGSGYPFGLEEQDISLQARIMVVADIFEALTARDRPYKDPMSLSRAIAILGEMKEEGRIDGRLHDLLMESGLIGVYAREELDPEQVDIPLEAVNNNHNGDVLLRRLERSMQMPPPRVERRRPLLLVVDDSDSNRMLLSYYLKDAPFDLDFAEDGVHGLSRLAGKCHDALLVDLELTPMDGYELARRVRHWEQRHHLPARPVLAMAAPFLPHTDSRLDEAGFTASLSRPFGRSELLLLLEQFVVFQG